MTDLQRLYHERDELEHRMDVGANAINEARKAGRNVADWEDHWEKMRLDYGKLCDRIARLETEGGK